MRETTAIIERVVRIDDHFQHLHLTVEDSLMEIKPGQSLLARLGVGWSPYLREQWWPVALKPGELIVERPGGQEYRRGTTVSLLGFVGQPFRFKKQPRNVLFMTWDTPPTPLMLTAGWLLHKGVSVTLVLAGTARRYPTRHLPPELEVLHADDNLAWPNMVMTLGWPDQIFLLARPDDELLAMARLAQLVKDRRSDIPANFLFGVFQPPMPCGAGACGACLLALRGGGLLTLCTDGPAVDLTTLPLPDLPPHEQATRPRGG